MALSLVVAVGGLWGYDCSLKRKAKDREACFVGLHHVLMSGGDDYPEGFASMYPKGEMEALLKPFPKGLAYGRTEDGFVLEEPEPCKVSLFREDRLRGTESLPPAWVASGKLVDQAEYLTVHRSGLFSTHSP